LTIDTPLESIEFTFLKAASTQQIAQIIELYRMADWWSDEDDRPEEIQELIRGSHCYCIASIGADIIGIGRAISDAVSDAYIQDIAVNPSYRRKGIASRIVEELVNRLRQDGLAWIGLIAERGTQPFYDRLGFVTMPNSTPMLLKKS